MAFKLVATMHSHKYQKGHTITDQKEVKEILEHDTLHRRFVKVAMTADEEAEVQAKADAEVARAAENESKAS